MNAATVIDHPIAPRLNEIAAALTEVLPALAGWRLEALSSPAVSDVLPLNARAVVATCDGVGRIALLASAPLATGLGDGDEGLAQLAGALAAAAGAAGLGVGAPVETGADTALLITTGDTLLAVRLLDGETHMATLAVVAEAVPGARPLVPPSLDHAPPPSVDGPAHPLELLHDVEMAVTVELGRTRMLLRDVLSLAVGSVIELDRAVGSPVDMFVNGTLIARGEVVVVDEEFGVRITEVVGAGDPARGR